MHPMDSIDWIVEMRAETNALLEPAISASFKTQPISRKI